MPTLTYDEAEGVLADAKRSFSALSDHVVSLLRIWKSEPKRTRIPPPSVRVAACDQIDLTWNENGFTMIFYSPTRMIWRHVEMTQDRRPKIDTGESFTDAMHALRELVSKGKKRDSGSP